MESKAVFEKEHICKLHHFFGGAFMVNLQGCRLEEEVAYEYDVHLKLPGSSE